jgi:nicotinate-nucleotide adenylyltransferase
MRWGLFGGAFDPIHHGHLRCVEDVREQLALERVFFIPVARPPHRDQEGLAPFEHRLRMVQLAIEGNPVFAFSDVENRRDGVSYSIQTVAHFMDTAPPGTELFFIVGQDAFLAIRTWREWERLLSLCSFVIMTRPGYERVGLETVLTPETAVRYSYEPIADRFRGPAGTCLYFRAVTFLDIAASNIRERVAAGRSIAYLTPAPVQRYIEEYGLYRTT